MHACTEPCARWDEIAAGTISLSALNQIRPGGKHGYEFGDGTCTLAWILQIHVTSVEVTDIMTLNSKT